MATWTLVHPSNSGFTGAGAFAEGQQLCLCLGLNLKRAARAATLGEGCKAVAGPPSAAELCPTQRARQQTPAALGAASARGLGDGDLRLGVQLLG
eukprot:15462798-Alexandrium_andersonii.AAC.1